MRKKDELTDPASCMSRARDDEFTFVLLGRDAAAPVAIRAWITERVRLGKNQPDDAQIQEAYRAAMMMELEQGREIAEVCRVTGGGFVTALVRVCFINASGNADCRFAEPFRVHQAGEIVVVPLDHLRPLTPPEDAR